MADDHVPLDYFDFRTGVAAYHSGGEEAIADAPNTTIDGGKKKKKTKAPPVLHQMNSAEMRDFILNQYKRDNPNLSSLELKEIEKNFPLSTCLPGSPAIKNALESFPKYEKMISDSRCRVLVLCESAKRCLDVLKEISSLKGNKKAAKLFGKHKLSSEQIQYLKKSGSGIGVGTPGRILSLIDADKSLFEKISYIIIDGHRDLKTRSIFDMQEVRKPIFELILKGKIPVSPESTFVCFAGF